MTTFEHARQLLGQRVRLAFDVDRYPHFVAPKGATGVVTKVDHDLDWPVFVRMDDPIDGAEEWDNEVHFTSLAEFLTSAEPVP